MVKFTRFTSLFVSLHLKRVEASNSFPIVDFLSLLYQYTFMQASLEAFLSCLEIWDTFLDYLISQQEGSSPSSLHLRYADALAALAQELTRRSQFATNAAVLCSLDAEESSAGVNDSELESYLEGCLNLIGKVSQLYPEKILGTLAAVAERLSVFISTQPLSVSSEGIRLAQDAEASLRVFSQTVSGFVSALSGLISFSLASGACRHC